MIRCVPADDAEERCTDCRGQGWRFVAPPGVNPFAALAVLADALERRTCPACGGAGTRHPDQAGA